MHYYKKDIGDYNTKAGRLSILQHGVYNLLMDAIYDREQFPTYEDAVDWLWVSSPEEHESLKFVLSKFFILEGDRYVQKRMKDTIEKYHAQAESNAINGKKGGRPKKDKITHPVKKKTHSVNDGLDIKAKESEPAQNKTLTTNQELITTNKKESKRKPAFAVPTQNEIYDHFLIKQTAPSLALRESEKFFNYYESNGWIVGRAKMKNWKAAATNWINRSGEYERQQNNSKQDSKSILDSGNDWADDIYIPGVDGPAKSNH